MAEQNMDKDKNEVKSNNAAVQPDPETLNTSDPQDHMEGPLSSLMQSAGETFDNNKSEEELNKEADNRK